MSEEKKVEEKATSQKTSLGLDENLAGLLCYLAGFVTGIVFLLLEKENKFVRFHAMQSTITFLSLFVIGTVCSFIPIIGWIIGILITPLSIILWVLLMYKAFQGEYYKLPIAGDITEKQLTK